MKNFAVIGVGFGDEGKGMVVSSLCQQYPDALVVRFCGGQQAGHHVVLPSGLDHVFSNFGSGTLQGNPTYWSSYCTVDPVGVMNELRVLIQKGIHPTLYLNEMCPVTTPSEKEHNQSLEKKNSHGTCGVGVGQTIQRQEDHYSLRVMDLLYPSVLRMKLELIRQYYRSYILTEYTVIQNFIQDCHELVHNGNIKIVNYRPHFDTLIFEGSQGLLLDQHFGFFPHVTRASTGTRNIINHLKFKVRDDDPYLAAGTGNSLHIYLVTRAYQTRHGNGPMTNMTSMKWINPYEQQIKDGWQGGFRTSVLDLDLLKYAIQCDWLIKQRRNVSLVVTCLDLVKGEFLLTENGKLFQLREEQEFIERIRSSLRIDRVFLSRDPYPGLEEFE